MATTRTLADLLRASAPQLIDAWKDRVRALAPARELADDEIVDHLPRILEHVARFVDTGGPSAAGTTNAEYVHAIDRLALGYDLHDVLREYAVLKRVVLERWRAEVGREIPIENLLVLDAAFDEATSASSLRFARARERVFLAVDKVARAAFGTTSTGSCGVFSNRSSS